MYSVSSILGSWQSRPCGQHTQQRLNLTLQRSRSETRNYEARILVKMKGYVLYQETASCPGKGTAVIIDSKRPDDDDY